MTVISSMEQYHYLDSFVCGLKKLVCVKFLSLSFLEVSLSANSILFKTKFTKNSLCVF